MESPIEFPDDAIIVTQTSDNEISFDVNQEWVDEITGLAINTGDDECQVYAGVDVSETFDSFDSDCYEGIASITVVVFLEEFETEECDACSVTDLSAMNVKFCAYSIEIPCENTSVECGEPSASPSGSFYPSSVPSDPPSISAEPTAPPTESPSATPTGTDRKSVV